MELKVDHVTIAASRLETLQDAFAEVGLATDYGGPHSNRVTHMALLGFNDGSYIELISTIKQGDHSPWWHEHISNDGGPCAWAVEVDDVAQEAQRLRALGIAVDGPHYYTRVRPDGTLIEWDLAVVGDQGMGALLPFIIKDRTPRRFRVAPSASVSASELSGVALIVLAVESLASASPLFERVYDLKAPERAAVTAFGATLARFRGQPFALAEPLGPRSWLGERLERFGVSPCAFLIGTRDLRASSRRFGLRDVQYWWGRQVTWFDSPVLHSFGVGLVSAEAGSSGA
jgi:hypothetical protein